ncbi:hypothetical protein, partial [Pseudoalteromonas sp. CO109Y]|uniref:hypothetical protein n=1 Tax=Pseudoalteromonas sp. CO109Y TaxID=1777235 RepID=UPI00197D3FF5
KLESKTPEPLTRDLPPTPALPNFHHIEPARNKKYSETSKPKTHDPKTPSDPPPYRENNVLNPSPHKNSYETPSYPTHPKPSKLTENEQPTQPRETFLSQRPHHDRLSRPKPDRKNKKT